MGRANLFTETSPFALPGCAAATSPLLSTQSCMRHISVSMALHKAGHTYKRSLETFDFTIIDDALYTTGIELAFHAKLSDCEWLIIACIESEKLDARSRRIKASAIKKRNSQQPRNSREDKVTSGFSLFHPALEKATTNMSKDKQPM